MRVGERADSDFVGLGLAATRLRNPGYTRLDARARVRVAGPLEAFLAGENLLDARYEEVLGYPALGRALRGGVRLAPAAGPDVRRARARRARRSPRSPSRPRRGRARPFRGASPRST